MLHHMVARCEPAYNVARLRSQPGVGDLVESDPPLEPPRSAAGDPTTGLPRQLYVKLIRNKGDDPCDQI